MIKNNFKCIYAIIVVTKYVQCTQARSNGRTHVDNKSARTSFLNISPPMEISYKVSLFHSVSYTINPEGILQLENICIMKKANRVQYIFVYFITLRVPEIINIHSLIKCES